MNIEQAINSAIELYSSGNIEQAERICREILEEQPGNSLVLHLLGVICYVSGRNDSAIEYLEEALRLNPTDAEAHYNCGNAYKDKERFDLATLHYSKALQYAPLNPLVLVNLGYVLAKQGKAREAEGCYREALKLDPSNALAHFNLGNLFFDKEMFDEAAAHYRTAVAIDPQNADAYRYLGGISRDRGSLNEAAEYYQKAIAVCPDDADAYNYLGGIFQDLGQLDRAIKCYEKAVALDPNLIIYNNLFLAGAKGVIHVGANLGQERDLYASYGLDVIWIEPIPEVYEKLKALISTYPRQKAFCYLVTDTDDKEYRFNVSNKGGGASSIYDLAGHKELWPDVSYEEAIPMKSVTLSSMIRRERLDMTRYDILVLDTQGAELLVLKGAAEILPRIRYVRSEVADFEAYAGCCRLDDMDGFFKEADFRRIAQGRFATKKGVGSYYDVLYCRNDG